MKASHRAAAVVACGLVLGAAGCSTVDDKPAATNDTPAQVTAVEPTVDATHRFADLIMATFNGLERVDLFGFQGNRMELSYAMFGHIDHFTVVGGGTGQDAAEFCVRDMKHDTWFASHAQPSKDRAVFIAGDGDECSFDPDDAAAITELVDDKVTRVKGPKVVTALIKRMLRAPVPSA